MHELMLLLSSAMPENFILNGIAEAITEYKANPSKETRGKVSMFCTMFVAKEATDNMPGGVEKMIERVDKTKQAMELLDPKKN
jgi:hypothetical protein